MSRRVEKDLQVDSLSVQTIIPPSWFVSLTTSLTDVPGSANVYVRRLMTQGNPTNLKEQITLADPNTQLKITRLGEVIFISFTRGLAWDQINNYFTSNTIAPLEIDLKNTAVSKFINGEGSVSTSVVLNLLATGSSIPGGAIITLSDTETTIRFYADASAIGTTIPGGWPAGRNVVVNPVLLHQFN